MKLTETQLEILLGISTREIETLKKEIEEITKDRNTYKDLYYYKEEAYNLLEKKYDELTETLENLQNIAEEHK